MALTPEGTPYVESSDLVANYPAASLSLANRVDLVGVLPFANAAARTTAIPTPTDGQFTYLQDTNSTEFYNGSAFQALGGAAGLSIVTPTSIANSGGSASASGGAVTFTGVTSISLNGVFTATYANYLILFFTSTLSAEIRTRLRTSGTDAITGYSHTNATLVTTFTQTIVRVSNNTATAIPVLESVGATTGYGQIALRGPQLAETTRSTFYGGMDGGVLSVANGNLGNTTSYDGFTMFATANNMTGNIRVYGYQNS